MRRSVTWSHDAVEALVELTLLEPRTTRKILISVRRFGMGERIDFKKLAGGSGRWRIRVGDWRILLSVDGNAAVIEAVDNRRDAY